MTTQYISSRQLLREYKSIKRQQKITIVMERSQPKTILVPFSEEALQILEKQMQKSEKNPYRKDIEILEKHIKIHKNYDPILDTVLERLKKPGKPIPFDEVLKSIEALPE